VSDEPRDETGKKGRPWRENIEAITVSIIVIVLFKYFVLEAYKIPTGSMQPTLMGWTPSAGAVMATGNSGGLHDRVLVDKLSFHFRDPDRWEVVVFKYPLDRSKNFIKRIVGMPDEDLEVRYGDIYAGPRGGELSIVRRPRPVLDSMLLLLDTEGEWRSESGGWSADGDTIGGVSAGSIRFPRTTSGVRDAYEDGYPTSLREAIRIDGGKKNPGRNGVGDLRFEASVRAAPETEAVRLTLTEGRQIYVFELPGPAAAADARPTIQGPDGLQSSGEAWRLPTDGAVEVAVANIDDELQLEVAGRETVTLEIPAVFPATGSGIHLESKGGGATFAGVRTLRDIYYTDAGYRRHTWEVPEESYVMLGDNTLNSSDGRDWSFVCYRVPVGDEIVTVRANDRRNTAMALSDDQPAPGDHPQVLRNPMGPSTVFLQDEWGERWVFSEPPGADVWSQDQAFVPRRLIQGRAVMVVWPLSPTRGVYRVQWVH
jgi:signal peptidase I